jgi:hypothetical protein
MYIRLTVQAQDGHLHPLNSKLDMFIFYFFKCSVHLFAYNLVSQMTRPYSVGLRAYLYKE